MFECLEVPVDAALNPCQPVRSGKAVSDILPGSTVRLTARGRLLAVVLLSVVLVVAFSVGSATAHDADSRSPTVVRVQPGDTFWSIARRAAHGDDPRDVIAQMQRLNGDSTGVLRTGQEILLPPGRSVSG